MFKFHVNEVSSTASNICIIYMYMYNICMYRTTLCACVSVPATFETPAQFLSRDLVHSSH